MAESPDREASLGFSEEFYKDHAYRYAEVSHKLLQSVYVRSSHEILKDDFDLLERLKELALGRCGLHAGCGAGARDVYDFWLSGYDIYRVDAVEENICSAASCTSPIPSLWNTASFTPGRRGSSSSFPGRSVQLQLWVAERRRGYHGQPPQIRRRSYG